MGVLSFGSPFSWRDQMTTCIGRRKFIYDHPDLRAQIELKCAQAVHRQADDMVSAARVTGASLRSEVSSPGGAGEAGALVLATQEFAANCGRRPSDRLRVMVRRDRPHRRPGVRARARRSAPSGSSASR